MTEIERKAALRAHEVWGEVCRALDRRDRDAIACLIPHLGKVSERHLVARKAAEWGWRAECLAAAPESDVADVALVGAEHGHVEILDALARRFPLPLAAIVPRVQWPCDDSALEVAQWFCRSGVTADEVLRCLWPREHPATFAMLVAQAVRPEALNVALERALYQRDDKVAAMVVKRLVTVRAGVSVTDVKFLSRARSSELIRDLIHHSGPLDLDAWLMRACIEKSVAVARVLLEEGACDPGGRAIAAAHKTWPRSDLRELVDVLHEFQVEEAVAERLRVLAEERLTAPPVVLEPEIKAHMKGDDLIEFRVRPRHYDASARDVMHSAYSARWDREDKEWRLPFSMSAVEAVQDLVAEHGMSIEAGLRELADAQLQRTARALTLSAATRLDDANIPAPLGLEYMGFQKAGIAYAVEKGSAIIGDEPGLGKTIQAIGVANAVPEIKSVLVVVPGSLKANWRREWAKWSVADPNIGIVSAGNPECWPAHANVVIISHQMVVKHREQIDARHWDLLVLDEAHRAKNPKAQRTIAIFGKEDPDTHQMVGNIKADRLLALTGTPIMNRPVELWTLLRAVCPARFNNFFAFAKRYCAATRGDYGWDFSGASNLGELQNELRAHCMVRRLKADVLKDLPRKIRQIIPIENDKIVRSEAAILAKHKQRLLDLEADRTLAFLSNDTQKYRAAVRELKAAGKVAFKDTVRVRHQTALKKVPQVAEMLEEELEDSDQKIILFAHHADVIDAYAKAFGPIALVLDGRVPMNKRQGIVDRFQEDPSIRVFIGGVEVAGVGYTLTAASLVAIAEPVWRPADLTQAEDRAHRIGQLDSVRVWHIVVDGTIEQHMMETVVAKQAVIDAALDEATKSGEAKAIEWGEIPDAAPEVEAEVDLLAFQMPELSVAGKDEIEAWWVEQNKSPEEKRAQRRNEWTAQRAEERALERGFADKAGEMTPEQVAAVHDGLRALARVCDGAVEDDGIGFNGSDTTVGRALASMDELNPLQAAYARDLVRKYVGQLGEAIIARMWEARASDDAEEETTPVEMAPGM
jgi:SNF2 family DNA or RNA helicase